MSAKLEKSLFPASHSAARTAPSAKPRRDLAIVAEINPVVRRIEDEFVHAHDIPFAERNDLHFLSAGFA